MANLVFVDRQSTYPNRYKVTPVDGTPYFAVLERADEPVVAGTPLNAETMNALASGATIETDATLTQEGKAADAAVVGSRLTECEAKVQTNLESIGQHTLLIQNLTDRVAALEEGGVLTAAEGVSF